MRRRAVALGLLAFATLSAGASTCVSPASSFKKSSGAVTPSAETGSYATVSQCPSFASYQAQVDAILQRQCLTCHGSGGQGSANYEITSGDSTDNTLAAANFYVSREKGAPTGGTASASDPDSTSPILARVNGTVSHPYSLDIAGSDYLILRNWVVEELSQLCTIDATTGTVTVGSGS